MRIRTKNMYYEVSEASNELELFAINDSGLYFQWIQPTLKNLKKKFVKGNFDSLKAIWSFYQIACAAAKKYKQDIPSTEYTFTVQVRWTVAENLLRYYTEDITE